MIAMFGDEMPLQAVELLWNAAGSKTIGEVRAELRAMARRAKEEVSGYKLFLDMREHPPHPLWIREAKGGAWLKEVPADIAALVTELVGEREQMIADLARAHKNHDAN